MSKVGQAVGFYDYNARGEEVRMVGVVLREFTEPMCEDPLQRLNYSVKCGDGSYHTPYAHECFRV